MKKIYLPLLFALATTIVFAQNPMLLKDVYPGATGSGIQQIVKTSNYTFFNAEDDDADTDVGLYRTDGTASGTIKLNLSYTGYNSTKAEKLTALGNKIIFAGDNFANYGEIWASDGTQAGTVALERFQPTLTNVKPVMDMAALGNEVLYGVVNSSNRSLLKKTDGTTAGTSVVYDFSSLNRAMDLALFKTINNILYFNVYDIAGTGVDQLWRSDGTTAGTYMVKDFGLDHYVASFYMNAGSFFYMMLVQPGTGNVLWKSDGTSAGTVELKTIGTTGNNNYPAFTAIGNTLYFAGLDGNGKELWKTDGTAVGTVMVSDINPGTASSNPFFFTLLNGNIYFSATTANEGAELWKFDGVNISLVKDINPGMAGSAPGSLVVSNNTILFRALTATSGSELWITDGTSANTLQVADINAGAANAVPNILTPGNPVYFSANNGVNGAEIFKFDNSQGLSGLHKLYVNDNSTSGDIFTTAVGNNANQGTKSSPVATVSYAVSIAQAGDTIMVDAGTFTEQVIIDKGITIKGAGQNLTSVLTPSTTLVPARGPFTEIGLIETTQGIGDVHISDLSVTSNNTNPSQNIIIQSGGSVKNCKLLNGGQGIFFRIEAGARNALVENNEIQPTGIGVNCQGSGLSATIINNTITKAGGYYAGIFAGLDFGPLVQLTATGNLINNYFGVGLLANSFNSIITQNSITGTGTYAIQRYNNGAVPNATCNWFGTTNAEAIAQKMDGVVNYSPWLTDGTDNNVATGFQPLPNVCNGRQNKFYVNDNSNTGNVFTTAVGNDANSGIPAAPLLTIDAALTKAQAGDTIFVDAGTYALATKLTINKAITILGGNYLVSPNNAADKTQYNSGRNTESIITGSTILIGADNIKMNGLRFSTDTTAVSLFADYSHIKFDKNIFDVARSGASLNLQGVSATPIVAFDFSVTDCRFERKDLLSGSNINLGLVKSIWIDNNTFIETPTTGNPYRGIALRTVPGQSVEGAYFSNNYLKKLGTGVLPTIVQDFGINNNIFDSCTTGYNHNPNGAVSNNIFIRTNTFTNTRVGRSILVRGGSGGGINNLNIIDNTINQEVDGINGITGMIQLDFALANTYGDVSVLANRINISGNYLNAGPRTNPGVILIGKHSNTKVWYNDLNFTATNAYYNGLGILPNVPTGIFISTDGGTGSGNIPANAVINITNNKINGFKNSIGIYDPTATGLNSFVGYGNLTAGAVLNVNNNSFTNDSISVDNGVIGQNINATCNWFGTADAAVVIPKISSQVTYSPWLTNGTDTDAGAGFEPVSGACNGRQNKFYVNDNSNTGNVFTTAIGNDANRGIPSAPFATINYALAIAQAGDTIYMDAGSYTTTDINFNIILNKSITIRGTNYLVSPNNTTDRSLYNTSRNSETIINNSLFVVGANDITIEGLHLNPGIRSAFSLFNNATTNDNFGNFRFEKNVLRITNVTNNNQFGIIGKFVTLPNMPITSGYTINDNRFEKISDSIGTTFNFNYVKNIAITNNSFVVTGTTFKKQNIANLGNLGIVDNYIFQNNFADGSGIIANCARVSSGVISQNLLNNCDRGINVTGFMGQSSSLEFNNNTLIQTTGGTPFLGYNRTGPATLNVNTIFKVQDNIFSGTRVEGLQQFFGVMNFTINNSEKNPVFTISGNKINFYGNYSSVTAEQVRPVTVRGNVAHLTLSGNEISFNNTGTILPAVGLSLPSNPAITINTDFTSTAYIPANALINISNNKIHGFKQSVVFYDPFNGINSYIGYGNIPAGATVNINNNSFTGDSISINSGTVGEIINATCNWFGSAAAQNVSPKVTETTVNYSPWLTNGTDNDVATGFQPVANVCNGVPVDADIILVTNITCNGAANGSIDVLVEEGLAPFTYAWSKDNVAGFRTTEDLNNLSPGDYKLIVTDANGSVDSVLATITEPDLLTASATGTNNLCFGAAAGTAIVSPVGGTTPYTYLWSNGATTDEITNLVAENYSVSITDANGCKTNTNYTVTQPTQLTAVATGVSTACSNSASVVASGGTGAYTYLWSNGSTNNSVTSLSAGTYNVTVTDANGCTAFASVTVNANEAFNPSASVTDVSCFGSSNGKITVTNVNGAAPFSYSIDGLTFQTGLNANVFNYLPAGTYTITVVDANGCTGFVTKTISQPPLLTSTLGIVQSTCFGLNTGSISVTVAGGSGAYSYAWTGPGYTSTQKNINNLATGDYSLIVTDNNGCTASLNVTVPSYTEITVTPFITNIACKGQTNGAINLTVIGGTGSLFSYNWSNGATTNNISNLVTGNYSVTITDNGSGCVVTKNYIITQPSSIVSLATTKTNATGCNSLGTITATGSGGTPYSSPDLYRYSKDGVNYQTSGLFSGLYAGNYTIWVKDANGCTKNTVVSITDNGSDEFESNNSKSQAKLINTTIPAYGRIALSTDVADWFKFTTSVAGTYVLNLSHPSVNYTFNLYPAGNNTAALIPSSPSATSKQYNNLLANTTYYIQITGGLSFNCYTLFVAPPPSAPLITSRMENEKPTAIEINKLTAIVYPNPHRGSFNIKIASPESGSAIIELYTASGQKLAVKNVAVQKGDNNIVPFSGIRQGSIFYRVHVGKQSANGKVIGME